MKQKQQAGAKALAKPSAQPMPAPEFESEDMDSPEWQRDLRWWGALRDWRNHDAGPLAAALRDQSLPLTSDIREFLADLVEGKVNHGKGGRPTQYLVWVERSIVSDVFREWDAFEKMPKNKRLETPKALACDAVAKRRGVTADTVRALVDKLRAVGITREAWHGWGRPDWKPR